MRSRPACAGHWCGSISTTSSHVSGCGWLHSAALGRAFRKRRRLGNQPQAYCPAFDETWRHSDVLILGCATSPVRPSITAKSSKLFAPSDPFCGPVLDSIAASGHGRVGHIVWDEIENNLAGVRAETKVADDQVLSLGRSVQGAKTLPEVAGPARRHFLAIVGNGGSCRQMSDSSAAKRRTRSAGTMRTETSACSWTDRRLTARCQLLQKRVYQARAGADSSLRHALRVASVANSTEFFAARKPTAIRSLPCRRAPTRRPRRVSGAGTCCEQ